MSNNKSFSKKHFLAIVIAILVFLPLFNKSSAQPQNPSEPAGTITGQEGANQICSKTANIIGPKILGHYLGCDPSCPPANGGCNFRHAVKFIVYLIGKAYILGIFLAIAMIMYAGYKIIFAGAKGEDYKEGGKIIRKALIGFAITVLASFIVQLIVKIFY